MRFWFNVANFSGTVSYAFYNDNGGTGLGSWIASGSASGLVGGSSGYFLGGDLQNPVYEVAFDLFAGVPLLSGTRIGLTTRGTHADDE